MAPRVEVYRVASERVQQGPWCNRLVRAHSPYLRQHADQPVDWFPWGEEAFAEAARREVPIFLSIGYAACHWCHVMARESFAHPPTAAILNAHFVSIKVDREEHPDVDAYSMATLLRLNGEAGWPASLFLTPVDHRPFQGGTYYPPYFRYGTPAFSDVLKGVADTWRQDRSRVRQRAADLHQHLNPAPPPPSTTPEVRSLLDQGLSALRKDYDERYGGWGVGAKFPHPPRLALLLEQDDPESLVPVGHMLEAMERGGLHDHLGGGFHRYTVDVDWEVPHFEKMLADNAQLAAIYLRAWARQGERRWLQIGCETLEYLLQDLRLPGASGLLASSQDADDDHGEGAFYTWTPEEVRAALPNPALAAAVLAAYGVTAGGNLEGRTVLRRVRGDGSLLSAVRGRLLAHRRLRPAPARDEKPVVAWNALAAEALALGARLTGERRYLDASTAILAALLAQAPLTRVVGAAAPAVLEDHAALVLALLEQHAADGQARWLLAAAQQGTQIRAEFLDGERGVLYHTRRQGSGLPARQVQWIDHAEPAPSAWGLRALQHLAALGEEGAVAMEPLLARGLAEGCAQVQEQPDLAPTLLRALKQHHTPPQTVVISGEDELAEAMWASLAQRRWLPGVLLVRADPALVDVFSVLRGKGPGGEGRAWICEGAACRLPIRSVEALEAALSPRTR